MLKAILPGGSFRGRCNSALVALVIILGCAMASFARARDFNQIAPSGSTVRMHQYRSWSKDCKNNGGVVRLMSKPQHGAASPRTVNSHIRGSDFAVGGVTPCDGAPIKAFEVDYKPRPGFHGTDTFMIEMTSGRGKRVIDTYTVNVP